MKHYFQNYNSYLQDYPKLQKKSNTLKSVWYINNLDHLRNIYLFLLFSAMDPRLIFQVFLNICIVIFSPVPFDL